MSKQNFVSPFCMLALILIAGCSASDSNAIEIVKSSPAFGQSNAPTWGEIAGSLARQGLPPDFNGEVVVKGWSAEQVSGDDFNVFFVIEDSAGNRIATMYWAVNVRSQAVKYMPDRL